MKIIIHLSSNEYNLTLSMVKINFVLEFAFVGVICFGFRTNAKIKKTISDFLVVFNN